jgi:hypothetical protein
MNPVGAGQEGLPQRLKLHSLSARAKAHAYLRNNSNKRPKLLRIGLSSFGRFLMNLFAEVDGFYAEEFGGLA